MELNLFLELMKDADPMLEYEIERMLRDIQTPRDPQKSNSSDKTRERSKLWRFWKF